METREATQNIPENAPPEGQRTTGSDRRGFLRQVTAAGVGSAALTALLGAGVAQKAEAKPGSNTIRFDYYTLDVSPNNVTATNALSRQGLSAPLLNGVAHLDIPIGGFPVDSTVIYGAWYVPVGNIQNLSQFKTIDLNLNQDRSALSVNIAPAPGVTNTSLTIEVFVLHDPVP